jgi:type I restriction enzyme M protein
MQKSGKDNSGEKIYVKRSDGSGDFLLDEHGHRIVDHDLFNHDGLTQDGIAEAFMEFAKKEGLSFFDLGSSVTPFDAVKYERLMDELEAVELSLNEVLKENISLRMDSEYFQKDYLKNLREIEAYPSGFITFNEAIKTITGGATPLGADYPEDGVRFLRVQNIMHNYIDDSDLVHITQKDDLDLKRSKLKENDVLLTITGVSYGKSAVVTKEFIDCNINQHSVKITLNKQNFLPNFISTFLNSKLGKLQSDKNIVGVTRPALDYAAIKNFKLPLVSLSFQTTITKLIDFSYLQRNESKKFYQEAEDLLLSELGLKNWQPTEETVAVKSFAESFLFSGRLDAEYYQPKYDELYKKLETACLTKKWNLTELKNLSSTFKYGTSEPFEYIEKGVPFLRIADLQKYRFAEKDLKFISHEASQNQASVKTGDVLISRSGTLGLAIVIPEDLNNAIYGSYFILTRPNQNLIIPSYLALYINSLVGKLQTEQANTGGIQTNLTIPVLEALSIIYPPLEIQQKLVDKVDQSYDAEDKSKQLLEIAKTAVEKAIETDEATATDWINQQLQTLNIDIQKLE